MRKDDCPMTDTSATDAAAQAAQANQQRYNKALTSGDVPHIYFNEFQAFGGASDLAAALGVNERVACVLHMSAPVAKSLALNLLSIVNQFETATAQTVLTLEQTSQMINAPKGIK
jgi:hypothetical protein